MLSSDEELGADFPISKKVKKVPGEATKIITQKKDRKKKKMGLKRSEEVLDAESPLVKKESDEPNKLSKSKRKKKNSSENNTKSLKRDNDEEYDSDSSYSKYLRKLESIEPSESNTGEPNESSKAKHSKQRKNKMSGRGEKRKRVLPECRPADEIEKQLEAIIFGNADTFETDGEESDDEKFKEKKENKPEPELKPAWVDEDDEALLVKDKTKNFSNIDPTLKTRENEKYSGVLQEKFIRIMGAPQWAELGRKEEKESGDESDEELFRKTGNYVTSSEKLSKYELELSRCTLLKDESMSSSVVREVEFHPTSRVALVACSNGTANLFQVDGKINAKIQSIYFKNFPIKTAHFNLGGSEIIAGSNRSKHLFSYDMLSGKISEIPNQAELELNNNRQLHISPDGKYIVSHGCFGNMHIMTAKSKEWVGTLKMNGKVNSITFNRDGSRMYSHGSDGEVYIWDMNSRKCIKRFVDQGCISGTALCLSPNEQFLAAGSDSGVVNVYDNQSLLSSSSHPEPTKVLMNLRTEITQLKFNCTSELLCMASSYKDDAIRMVHFPSFEVYTTFPHPRSSVKCPYAVDFSPNSGYFSFCNNKSTIYLYRLKHYGNY